MVSPRFRLKAKAAAQGIFERNRLSAQPELLLQAELIELNGSNADGALIRFVALPWLRIVEMAESDPTFLAHFANNPRKFEEFIAATYDLAGFDEVILTPQRGDLGRDVIAIKKGFGSIRFLEQTKAYSPGHLVTHDDVRAMLGVLSVDSNSSKGLITTTSDFQPGIIKSGSEFEKFIPNRLELKNGHDLVKWLSDIKSQSDQ